VQEAWITVQVGESNTKDGPLCAVRHSATFHQDGGFHSEQRMSILSSTSALNQVSLHSGPQILDNLAFTFCYVAFQPLVTAVLIQLFKECVYIPSQGTYSWTEILCIILGTNIGLNMYTYVYLRLLGTRSRTKPICGECHLKGMMQACPSMIIYAN